MPTSSHRLRPCSMTAVPRAPGRDRRSLVDHRNRRAPATRLCACSAGSGQSRCLRREGCGASRTSRTRGPHAGARHGQKSDEPGHPRSSLALLHRGSGPRHVRGCRAAHTSGYFDPASVVVMSALNTARAGGDVRVGLDVLLSVLGSFAERNGCFPRTRFLLASSTMSASWTNSAANSVTPSPMMSSPSICGLPPIRADEASRRRRRHRRAGTTARAPAEGVRRSPLRVMVTGAGRTAGSCAPSARWRGS